jgi:hypothetical protein
VPETSSNLYPAAQLKQAVGSKVLQVAQGRMQLGAHDCSEVMKKSSAQAIQPAELQISQF